MEKEIRGWMRANQLPARGGKVRRHFGFVNGGVSVVLSPGALTPVRE